MTYFFLLFVIILIVSTNGFAQKTDSIYHVNGNVLTGEFKKMSYGVVTWKMDGMGTINLEEVKINRVRSTKQFEIKTKDGLLYFGSLDTAQFPRRVNIVSEFDTTEINIFDIVEIYPIKNSFWLRTSGTASLGFNYTKASNVGTIAFSGSADYRKKRTYFELSFDDNNTYQGDSLSSSKSDVTLAWQRLWKNRWSSEISVAASQNTALGSKLKLDLNVTGLYDISYNSWNRLHVGAGLNTSREASYGDSPETNDLAALFAVVWKVYKYTDPKLWVDASFIFRPYITSRGRSLTSININPQINLLNDDFKIGISYYFNYDTRPPEGAISKSDYAVNLQLSYKFH